MVSPHGYELLQQIFYTFIQYDNRCAVVKTQQKKDKDKSFEKKQHKDKWQRDDERGENNTTLVKTDRSE